MKKLLPLIPAVALVVVAVLLFSAQSPAKDQEFSIRDGIKFGMSIDEVKAIEGIPDLEDDSNLQYTVDIQGLERTQIGYSFSRGDYLSSIIYSFRDVLKNSANSDFELIDGVLKEKYGEPENIEPDGKTNAITEHKFTIERSDNIVITAGHFLTDDDEFMKHFLWYEYTFYEDPDASF